MKGSEKAQVAKEHSLMEKLNQVLEKSVTDKESKIEELRNELGIAQKENEYLRNKNQELSQSNGEEFHWNRSSNEGTSQTKIRDYRVDNNCNRKRKIDEISLTV